LDVESKLLLFKLIEGLRKGHVAEKEEVENGGVGKL